MLGFVKPSAGTVWMDEVSVAQAERQSWLGHIAWMPQRPTLVADTVAANVRLGAPDATDDEVASAMAAACCEGLDPRRRIAQNGADLSAGERQRIALARCFLRTERGASLLLLDEPTAHLDAPTEQRVLAAIRQFSAGRSVLMVAHRPAAIDFADRIVEIGAGIPRGAARAQRGAVMRRLLALAAPGRRRFFDACGIGVLSAGCGIGLIASAAWLISAASLQPHIAALTVAIVGVRVFALGKSALRYLERLVSHDIAFRMLADIRTRFVAALEPLSPGALPVYHRGDLLSRMVSDVDGLQDLPLRVLQPVDSRGRSCRIGCRCRRDFAPLLGRCPGCIARHLSCGGTGGDILGQSARRGAVGKSSGRTVSRCRHAAEWEGDLVAYGAAPQHLAELTALDAGLTRIARSSALAAGVGAGLAVICACGAVWAALSLGTSAVRDGAMSGVMLAVVVLIPLAAFEAVQVLPSLGARVQPLPTEW